MTKPLVVVESPTKVRTIKKYLGSGYNIAATIGHIRDLPANEMGVDIPAGFQPLYVNIPGKQKVISALKKAAGNAVDIYLAPDPDREGEAIAWHTAEILKKKDRRFHRVLFHELTPHAIKAAIAAPEKLHRQKYVAQQTRRILDRLVGYQLSPLLWRKVKSGLSAGRVQSVAVRIICERERAIQVFIPEEYWSITAHLEGDAPPPFTAKLVKKGDKKIRLGNEQEAEAVLKELAEHNLVVAGVLKKTVRKNPLPPFTTSKLQQEAIRKLRFTAKKTMLVAQQLYEGIDLGPGEPVGLITYMRTDSVRIAAGAAQEALKLIKKLFGDEYAPAKPRFFKNRNKVQDAHEAIRPASAGYTPDAVSAFLSPDQQALYRLIWQRFVASQMKEALIDQNSVSIKAGPYLFNASGSSIKFPGFMALYLSADDEIENEKKKGSLPPLTSGMMLKRNKFEPKQHFTLPPPRFSEASLVKELEENGIGRPSTYAAILSTIREKGYVELLKGYFRPTELGYIVNDLLVESFPDLLDVEFTAKMEENLDRIEAAEVDATALLSRFYDHFKVEIDTAASDMLSVKGVGFSTGLSCPQCRQALHIKIGKNGHFLACSAYPTCTYSSNYTRDEKGAIHPVGIAETQETDRVCEKCGKAMVVKQGKFGRFLACSGYPECKNAQSLNSNGNGEDTGVPCPQTGCDGHLLEKKSRRNKIFYGCSRFPACTFATWDKPVALQCPKCSAALLVEKSSKKVENYYACLTQGCGYKKPVTSNQ